MGAIIWADFLIILIGMSLALLLSRPFITFMISVEVQSSRKIFEVFEFLERNSVNEVNGLTSIYNLDNRYITWTTEKQPLKDMITKCQYLLIKFFIWDGLKYL